MIPGYRITTAALLLGDVVSVHRIRCSGNEQDISQCQIDFYTPLLSCDDRTVVALECEGRLRLWM